MTGSVRGGALPGRRSIGPGAGTGTGPEIPREAGGPAVAATEGTTAKTAHLIEGTEEARAKEDGEARTATGARGEGAAGAQIPEGAGGTARPETDGVPQGQTVQKAKKGRDPAPAPALTVTDILKLQTQKFALPRSSMSKCWRPSRRGTSHTHHSVKSFHKSDGLRPTQRRLVFSGQSKWKCFLSALL